MKSPAIITAMLIAGTLTVQADDTYQYLTIEKNDGTSLSLTAVGLTISYNETTLTATNGSETATLTLSELSRMYFSNTKETVGISDINALEPDVTATVYDLRGHLIAEGAPSAIKERLRKGVYLVKQNERTAKIVVK